MESVVTCRHNPQKHCRIQDILTATQTQPLLPALEPAGFGVTVSTAIEELLTSKRASNRRDVYVKSLKHYLTRFAAECKLKPIAEFTPADIEGWIKKHPGAYSRQTWLNRISTLFSFCVRKGYLASNPCDRVERVTVDHKPPTVLTVEQSRQLLAACPTVCKPWLVLALFAGIRPDGELMKLNWSEINLDTATAAINFPKVRKHRRIVPLEPVAVKLLSHHPLRKGMVAPSRSTLRRFKNRMRTLLGFEKWPADLLRHTAASFLIGLHKDNGKVAAILGNSTSILLTHYNQPQYDADVSRFWNMTQ